MSQRVALSDDVQQKLAPWYSRQLLGGTRILRHSFFGMVLGWFGQAAVTVNGTVHLTPRAGDLESTAGVALLAHELYHVLQEREQGWWRYLARYVWHWRPWHIRRGWEHPLERPAYARQNEVLRALA